MLACRTPVRLFSVTRVALGVGPYLIFLKHSKGKHSGIPVKERSKILAQEWKRLTPEERKRIDAEAKATPTPVRKMKNKRNKKDPKRTKRAPSKFALFVREHYNSVADLPFNMRLKRLSELYKAAKK